MCLLALGRFSADASGSNAVWQWTGLHMVLAAYNLR